MLGCGSLARPQVSRYVFRILGLQRVRFLVCFISSIVLGLRLGANTAAIRSIRLIGIGWRADRHTQDQSQHNAQMFHVVAASTRNLPSMPHANHESRPNRARMLEMANPVDG